MGGELNVCSVCGVPGKCHLSLTRGCGDGGARGECVRRCLPTPKDRQTQNLSQGGSVTEKMLYLTP